MVYLPARTLRRCVHRCGARAVGRRGTRHGTGLGTYRWVVERTFAWLHGFKRLRIRWERRADIHEARRGVRQAQPQPIGWDAQFYGTPGDPNSGEAAASSSGPAEAQSAVYEPIRPVPRISGLPAVGRAASTPSLRQHRHDHLGLGWRRCSDAVSPACGVMPVAPARQDHGMPRLAGAAAPRGPGWCGHRPTHQSQLSQMCWQHSRRGLCRSTGTKPLRSRRAGLRLLGGMAYQPIRPPRPPRTDAFSAIRMGLLGRHGAWARSRDRRPHGPRRPGGSWTIRTASAVRR